MTSNATVPSWTRDTPWRQGHILPLDAVRQLKLSHLDNSSVCVVVISHDCDLANDDLQSEPNVEIIIGCHPSGENGNFFWAKSPRTLHLEALHNKSPVVIELVSTAKSAVSKKALAAFTPDESYVLSGQSRAVLQSWLAVRYNRAAFPDLFVNRLQQSKVDKQLAKLIEPVGKRLSTVYFDVDSNHSIDHSDGSPYELKIVLLYPSGEDPEALADEMEALAERIRLLFEKKYMHAEKWEGIAIRACIAICEDDITVGQTKFLTEWRLEHMSLRALVD